MSKLPTNTLDGLIKIANANGLVSLTTFIDSLGKDVVCVCDALWATGLECYRLRMSEARPFNTIRPSVWDSFPEAMLRRKAMEFAIRKHFEKYGISEDLEATA